MPTTENAQKLLWLVRTFGLSVRNIGRQTGFSGAYVSRVTSGTIEPSPDFLLAVEQKLPAILESRQKQFFQIPSLTLEQLDEMPVPEAIKVA